MMQFRGNGNEYEGYLATPPGGSGPGVIVIQEWWGLVGHIKDVADRLAAEGFVALAPDLYQGKTTDEPDDAGTMMMALETPHVHSALLGAAEALLALPECSSQKLGVIGFCMGGQLALYAAAAAPDKFSACVNFYGIHPNVHPPFENLQAPVLGIFGGDDHITTPDAVRELDEMLTRLGKAHDFKTYPGKPHAFFNDQRPEVYDSASAADAWQRVLAFLRDNV